MTIQLNYMLQHILVACNDVPYYCTNIAVAGANLLCPTFMFMS